VRMRVAFIGNPFLFLKGETPVVNAFLLLQGVTSAGCDA